MLTLEMHFDTPVALMDELCDGPGFGILPFIVYYKRKTNRKGGGGHDMTHVGLRSAQ